MQRASILLCIHLNIKCSDIMQNWTCRWCVAFWSALDGLTGGKKHPVVEDTPSAQTWHPHVRFCGRLAQRVCVCVPESYITIRPCHAVAQWRRYGRRGLYRWRQKVSGEVRYRERKRDKSVFVLLWPVYKEEVILWNSEWFSVYVSGFARLCLCVCVREAVPLCKRFCPLRICEYGAQRG